ncbi:MAG: YdcF family protein, partial [Planctomycetota bacterium]
MKSLLPKDVFRLDVASHADVALVVGASDAELLRHRAGAGIALVRAKKTARLLLCGDGREKDPKRQSEAERMKQMALSASVSESQILIEDESQDVIELAKSLGRRLKSDDLFKSVRSVFLVSSAWHLLRVH